MNKFFVTRGALALVFAVAFSFAPPALADGFARVEGDSTAGAFAPNGNLQTGVGSGAGTTGSTADPWSSTGMFETESTAGAIGSGSGVGGASADNEFAASIRGTTAPDMFTSLTMQGGAAAGADDGNTPAGKGKGSAGGFTRLDTQVGFSYDDGFINVESNTFGRMSAMANAESGPNGKAIAETTGGGIVRGSANLGGVDQSVRSNAGAQAATVGDATADGISTVAAGHDTTVSAFGGTGSFGSTTGTDVTANASSTGGGSASATGSASSSATQN